MSSEQHSPDRPRLLVIGIDGMDFALTGQLMAAGRLPHLAALAARGAWGPLRSTTPPVTPCAWSTIMTGRNPGKHGIFDFLTGSAVNPVPAPRCAPTIWESLSAAGWRVGTFNVPATYPPQPLSAFQIAGFDAPVFGPTMAWPERAYDTLRAAVGDYDVFPTSIFTPEGDPAAVRQHVDLPLLGTRALLSQFPCDIYMVSFQIVDWVQHTGLGEQMPPGAGGHLDPDGSVAECYALVDDRVGALLREWTTEETTVAVVSDHGAAAVDCLVNLERLFLDADLMAYETSRGGARRWRLRRLRNRALLGAWNMLKRFGPGVARRLQPLARRVRGRAAAYQSSLAVDWSRSRAVPCGSFGQIRLNIRGRDPYGIVEPSEVDSLRQQVCGLLSALRDPRTGEPVYARIAAAEDIYHGPYVSQGPDLIAIPASERYLSLSGRTGAPAVPLLDARGVVVPFHPPSGWHSMNGVLMLAGPTIAAGTRLGGADVTDVAPTLLQILGEPVPSDMDGKPLECAATGGQAG